MFVRRRDRARDAITRILRNDEFVAVDIGARGDIPPPWIPLDGVATILSFDADPEACARLKDVYAKRGHGDNYRVFPIALAEQSGLRTLHVTNSGGGSSFFDMDTPLVRAYTDEDYLFPIRKIEVETRCARDVFQELGYDEIHMIKLDIQGAELEVLRSLETDALKTSLVVQLEAALQPKGAHCPSFTEVDGFMRSAGFQLYDLAPTHVHRSLKGKRSNYLEGVLKVHRRTPTVAGRAWEVEALYARSPESLLPAGAATMRRLIVCFGLYSLYTEALHCVDVASRHGILDGAVGSDVRSAVVQWHRFSGARWWHGTSPVARAIQRAVQRVRLRSPVVRGALDRWTE